VSWTLNQSQTGGAGSVTSLQVTLPGAVTAGDLIVVLISMYGTTTTSTVGDNINSGTHNALANEYGVNESAIIFGYIAAAGGTAGNFKVTWSNGSTTTWMAMVVLDLSFTGTGAADGSASMGSASSSNPHSAAITPSGTDFCVNTVCFGAASTNTIGSGWTLGGSIAYASGGQMGLFWQYALNQTASITPSSTCTSQEWECAAFQWVGTGVTSAYSQQPYLVFPSMYFPSMIEE